MNNTDVILFTSLKRDLISLLNSYMDKGLPVTIQLPVIESIYKEACELSEKEIQEAVAESNLAAHNNEEQQPVEMPEETNIESGGTIDLTDVVIQ